MQHNIFDFSDTKIRCHAAYFIVAPGKTKTPKQKYDDLLSLLVEEQQKYDDMGERKQGMASGLSKAAKIAGIEQELKKLEPKRFEDPLPTGCKSYLKRLYGEVKYGKWSATKDIGTKYTNKGKQVEQDALDLIGMLDGRTYKKNEQRLFNEFITGIPDSFYGESVERAEYVPDVKASWDFETFIANAGESLSSLYWWQMQGYFELTSAEIGEVSYCLINTPESMINEEKYKLAKRLDALTDETEEYKVAEKILVNNLTFDDIHPMERRLKFEVKRDSSAFDQIKYKVPLCRDYLFELQEMHLTGFFTDKELPILETIEEI